MKRLKYISLFPFFLFVGHCFATNYSDTTIIKYHLTAITKSKKFRTYKNIEQLNETAEYIKSVFNQFTDSVFIQEYSVNGQIYKNVICSFGTENYKRVIVGAHYDVCENQEGADDNASGVVGLLELSRLLKGQILNQRIDLVAYSLEEPPFFRTEYMGSYIHAKSLSDNKTDVYGMISLEMIGYFKDEKKTQQYPIGLLSLFYGSRGNYITLVKKFGAGRFTSWLQAKKMTNRTLTYNLMLLFTVTTLVACGQTVDLTKLTTGTWYCYKATQSTKDMTDTYRDHYVTFKTDLTYLEERRYYSNTDTGTYTLDKSTKKISYKDNVNRTKYPGTSMPDLVMEIGKQDTYIVSLDQDSLVLLLKGHPNTELQIDTKLYYKKE